MSNTNKSAARGGGRARSLRTKKGSDPPPDLNLSSLNSDPHSIPISPNRFQLLASDNGPCELCANSKTDNPEMLLLKCKRCKNMLCTTCVDLSVSDFNVLSRIDCVWCCPACRPKVEKAFEVDIKVEECKEYVSKLEKRIHGLEKEQKQFNDTEQYIKNLIAEELKKAPANNTQAPEVKRLISEEMKKQLEEVQIPQQEVPNMREIIQEQLDAEIAERGRTPSLEQPAQNTGVQEVITELQEQDKRRNNMILYNCKELHTADEDGRVKYDVDSVLELVNYLKNEEEEDFIDEHFNDIKRLGNYEQDRNRPLLVEFVSGEEKKTIFRKLSKLRDVPEGLEHLKTVSVCHDMTKTQREADKVLVERAKSFERQCSENCIFRVRGPPWKRYIKKIAISQERRNQNLNRRNDTTQRGSPEVNPNQRRVLSNEAERRTPGTGAVAAGR